MTAIVLRGDARQQPLPDERMESLAAWLAWLGTPDCTCPSQWKGLGILYGISLGDGWVRLDASADCPHHGKEVGGE